MDGSDIVLESALERIAAVEQELQRLLGKEFPGTAVPKVLSSLCEMLDSMRAYVKEPAAQDGAQPQESALEILGVTGPLIFIHHILQYFDHSDSSRVPFELISAFETLAQQGAGVPMSFVFRPNRSFSYEIIDLEPLMRDMGEDAAAVAGAAKGVQVVLFPAAEAGSSLIHTILFHEVGHACYAKYMDVASAHTALSEAVKEVVGAAIPDDELPKTLDVLNAWMRELFSDCLALRLVGPAYVCAFRWYTVPVATSPDSGHPSPELRLAVMSHYLKRLREGHKSLDALCKLFGDHAEPDPLVSLDIPTPAETPATPHERVRAALGTESFRAALFASFDKGPTVFGDDDLAAEIQKAADEIALFIPPGASDGSSPSLEKMLAVAFNACWLFRVGKMSRWSSPVPDGFGWSAERCVQTLNQLCLAAVEGGELLHRYRQQGAAK